MGQVSEEISPKPPSGRPGYNLGDFIRERERSLRRGGSGIVKKKNESDSIVTQEQV